ncbi:MULTISPECIES: hypothetical protein [Pseudofrankia]|uniref:hypothetical protein n=1 Tax=Pseudofrankia TaxID=2994363 RepID=UPI000234C7EC|nr:MULTISPECIES: hypothetical protein [Pseudofrankia]OHV27674.1 chromosome partitioning protein [Pseudofrankia sp. EUN1h]
MTGIEVAVGVLFAWAVRKARRVGAQADAEVDRAVDAGMDRVHELVSRALGEDPALGRLQEEAQAGAVELSERTQQRVARAVEDAAERDPGFAAALDQAVRDLQAAAARAGGATVSGTTFFGPTAMQVGDHNQQTNTFGG